MHHAVSNCVGSQLHCCLWDIRAVYRLDTISNFSVFLKMLYCILSLYSHGPLPCDSSFQWSRQSYASLPVNLGFMQLALANAALLDVSCAEAEASVTWALQR